MRGVCCLLVLGEEEGENLLHVSVTVGEVEHLRPSYEKNHIGRSMPSLLQVLLVKEVNYLMEGLRIIERHSKASPPFAYPGGVRSSITSTAKKWVNIHSHVGR